MARNLGDIPQFKVSSPRQNLVVIPVRILFNSGTVDTSTANGTSLGNGVSFSSKTGTGIYRFNIPKGAYANFVFHRSITSNVITTTPSASSLVPTGILDIQTGTTAATTATDPANGIILSGCITMGWGR